MKIVKNLKHLRPIKSDQDICFHEESKFERTLLQCMDNYNSQRYISAGL
jgi:hypothetical protein